MQPRLDDALIEFSFSDEELLTAQVLDSLKIGYYQTLYAQLWKERNSIKAPENPSEDRTYFLQIAELDGQMATFQRLIQGHKTAIDALNKKKLQDEALKQNVQGNTEQQAAKLVHKQPNI